MTPTHEPPKTLQPGLAAPNFSLPTFDGKMFHLNDVLGKKVIIFFYPAALTPGCTKQACDFRDNFNRFTENNYVVLGISHDTPAKNKKFHEEKNLPYTLLCDEDFSVHTLYNAYGKKNIYGKAITGVIRSTFVLSNDHIIELALHNVRATGHVDSLLKKLSLV